MSQNRKRPHDQTSSQTSNGGEAGKPEQTNGGSGSNDSSPLSKRTLMSNNNVNLNNIAQHSKTNMTSGTKTSVASTGGASNGASSKQALRVSQKSNKPTQSINRVNAPEDIYYQINSNLNQLRHEVQLTALRKLARKPYKQLSNEYQQLYQTFSKLSDKALANSKLKETKVVAKAASDVELSGDEKNKDSTDECMLIAESDEKANENSNDKNDLVVDEEEAPEKKEVASAEVVLD